jgi:hypothetical protein
VLELLQEQDGAVDRMQQMVKQGWAKQVQEQRQSDEQVIEAAEAREYELEEEGVEEVRQITFNDFLEAAQRRLQKGGAQEEGLSARRKAMVARQWMGLGEGQQASSKTEYERAVAKAEMAVVVEQAANYGGEWLEVYSDASMRWGATATEDACGVGVWVAHKANKKGERQQLTPAEKCVARTGE